MTRKIGIRLLFFKYKTCSKHFYHVQITLAGNKNEHIWWQIYIFALHLEKQIWA